MFLEYYLLDVLPILKVLSRGTSFILQQGTPRSCAPTESTVLATLLASLWDTTIAGVDSRPFLNTGGSWCSMKKRVMRNDNGGATG